MRVLIPSTGNAEFIDGTIWHMSGGDDEHYLTFWRSVWAARRSVIVVDHDIIPTEASLKDLWDCHWSWCAQPYPYQGGDWYYGLGCVKFDELLMVDFPDLWQQVASCLTGRSPQAHPHPLEFWSGGVLYEHGYQRHHHTMPADRSWSVNPRHAHV